MHTETRKRSGGTGGWALWGLCLLLVAPAGCGDVGEYLGLSSSNSGDGADKKNAQKKGASGNKGSDGTQKNAAGDGSGEQNAQEADKGNEGSEDEDAEAPVPELVKKQEGAGETERSQKRNPFARAPNVREKKDKSKKNTKKDEDENPLERYSLGSLRLAAIISEVAVPKAMFIDPEGVGRLAKEGDRIGRDGGTIEDIRANEVVVTLPTGVEDGATREKVIELREATRALGRETGAESEERKMLDRMMRTKEGREALRESYQRLAPGANAAEEDRRRRRDRQTGQQQEDDRFPGLAPPEQQE